MITHLDITIEGVELLVGIDTNTGFIQTVQAYGPTGDLSCDISRLPDLDLDKIAMIAGEACCEREL